MIDLKEKNVLVGITGGIAAYKSAILVSQLKKKEARVKVIMTEAACRFITPLTLATLSGNPVYREMFHDESRIDIDHISLADWADYMIVAPATANSIGKITSGLADDLLCCTVMTLKVPVLICPAMNTNMFESPAVQENLKKLKNWGYTVMEPAEGSLACGTTGKGRMPEPDEIIDFFIANLK